MMDWVDELLGRITMYRSALYALVTLNVFAAVLMLLGQLSFQVGWFIASVVVFVGVSYASNRLFGWLFGVRPHSESALITGLILPLLFMPATSVLVLLKFAIVAAIAMASKYILAIRNRHIFNPAAIAAVVAGIGGLAYAGWWVANPVMLPITIVVSLLLLYRTKKIRMGLIFVGVAIVALLIQGNSLMIILTSWPLIFLAGIMLTEPLTLAPRAKQQYVIAAIIGILIALPITYGRISMTPALALVIGNLLGWWLGQRQTVKLRFVGKKQMGESTYDFTFDTKKLHYLPGQYLELTLIHKGADSRGHRRVFSIASKPDEDQLAIGTRIPKKPSTFKRALMNLKPGSVLYATRISGDFVLPDNPKVPIVCIAGGIGITPFVSFLESADRPVQIIYSLSTLSELSYTHMLRQSNADVTIVSPDTGPLPDDDWKHEKGRITAELLEKLIDTDTQPIVYVSGPPTMVLATQRIVKSLGITKVKVDEFTGY